MCHGGTPAPWSNEAKAFAPSRCRQRPYAGVLRFHADESGLAGDRNRWLHSRRAQKLPMRRG
ncbi:hypothetical protein LA76x_0708 [Lysobacter antibioticus]|uniref:Uncharacterized protein n=1 Tax=Lysobacter antibioticus TaxID=84531 RepID=A0A0S2F5P2_LYSAN|nr:hypothetical protein LA76x_0708 [Lysobacter antibioticus]